MRTQIGSSEANADVVPGELLIREARGMARRRRMITTAFVFVAAILLSVALVAVRVSQLPARTGRVSPSNVSSAALPICNHLSNAVPPMISPSTQEAVEIFAMRNVGPSSCQLDGYPIVKVISTTNTVIPFIYGHKLTGPFDVTTQSPTRVIVKPESTVYFIIASQTCAVPPVATSSRFEIVPPGSSQVLGVKTVGAGRLYQCPSGINSYANHLQITPIESTAKKLEGSVPYIPGG